MRKRVGRRTAVIAVTALSLAVVAAGGVAVAEPKGVAVAEPKGVAVAEPKGVAVRASDDQVRNLQAGSIKIPEGGQMQVAVRWDTPVDDDYSEYRVFYSHDWRPQRSIKIETQKERLVIRNLKPGRVYTVRVEASDGEYWGDPVEVTFTTPGPTGAPWVVSVGDSFISGEGGRWAGNTDVFPTNRSETDTGERSYFDSYFGETIDECHRSNSALIHIGVARSMNFACSGAITTSVYGSNGKWKPGIDRVARPDVDLGEFGPAVGQAQLLANFARTHKVKMVVLSIGGNNFFFSDIVTTCVEGYLFSTLANPTLCSEDERLAIYMSDDWIAKVKVEIKTAIQEVIWAMRDVGYQDDSWTLVQHLYPQPIARSENMRYAEWDGNIPNYRQTRGGCGMWDEDANWAIDTVLKTVNETAQDAALEAKIAEPTVRIVQMDTSGAFAGHELCSKDVYRLNSINDEDERGVDHWRHPRAADLSEWMKEIDVSNISAATKYESFHPGFWGQLALRNCLRQLWNKGNIVSGGKCTPMTGLNTYNEPNMTFTRDPGLALLN